MPQTQIAGLIAPAEFTTYQVENSRVSTAPFALMFQDRTVRWPQLRAGAQLFTVAGRSFWKFSNGGIAVKNRHAACVAVAMMVFSACALLAQNAMGQTACTPKCIPKVNHSYIDAKGTAHITRVVPVPPTVSPEAQKFLARSIQDIPGQSSALNMWEPLAANWAHTIYPVHLARQIMAGVPVRIVTPLTMPGKNRNRVLIDLHGGGFVGDGGSLAESIPIANLAQTKVVAVLYRIAPEHPFPAAVDDTVAVYKELLKTYKPQNIGMYGTSAGAMLTPEVGVRLRQLGLPLPAAMGIYGGQGDFSTAAVADSRSLYTQDGLSGHLDTPPTDGALLAYMGSANPKDPELSPIFADLHGFPPTLFITSTRDMMLSGTCILHRAFLRAGVDAHLIVFEALPHGFWYDPYLPESREAYGYMVSFFDKELGR